jgi:hypothetical protein
MAITQWGLPWGNDPFEQERPTSRIDAPDVSGLETHMDDVARHAQHSFDMNLRWKLFANEMDTKASILNTLSKLEDKYQVRG